MGRAELPDKPPDTESQPHQHALDSPFLVSVPETFYEVSGEGRGWGKEGFNTDFPAILVCFPSILLARGKSWGRDFIPEHAIARSLFGQGWEGSVSRAAFT